MSKTNRAIGTVAHVGISVPIHIILTVFTAGLWAPVWIIMEIHRRSRRRMERLTEELVRNETQTA